MSVTIKKYGNSQGIIIPANILNKIGVKIGQVMDLTVDEGKIVLSPSKRKAIYSESYLLFGLNEQTTHSDEIASVSSTELDE
ncbi:AbrB/MazE/SpoVT family DNA-binding domain-containing protein [Xenorhabdus bovienii]|uniref:AbrB/MazE/SpoVT family DNA-binding domain-containing protein n=1 Tax=Xenorhabdus bovienii TaxID=40576 RepID=UPI0023B2086B|nr:AbrB/MazE/SpoVT family DNA-binding domain-containing protein [Xenorhabdus bovienii]MDE9494400.1 AbrB/MazE/SpoVT family DNA-binding domain-containing protein [Xenorhabdus bovienii]MDE9502839.1 AbrB/MazE/SpoVT family DNA-binding domain-containing protein [Xenorhabdus bovienii]MDE9526454.1 AbrB/MazE/SpoVT family DNA-binding domain-containing protein [Xenorhabdus bovienii]